MPKAIVLTSTFLRHQHIANKIAEGLDVVGIWQEEKSFRPDRYAESEEEELIIARHFADRDASEREFFAADAQLRLGERGMLRRVTPGGVNDGAEVGLMRNLAPDVLVVFGTSMLREEILTRFQGKIVGLHLGLSPYYRGSGTNFWPLVNREPEYVGATIHYLNPGADSEPIIAHVRPGIEPDDGPHSLGNKTVIAAGQCLAEVAQRLVSGSPPPSAPQLSKGRLYRRKDFGAKAVRRLYQNFEAGMIQEYLDDQAHRDEVLELVQLEVVR